MLSKSTFATISNVNFFRIFTTVKQKLKTRSPDKLFFYQKVLMIDNGKIYFKKICEIVLLCNVIETK